MFKYLGKILIGGLIIIGIYANSLTMDSKAKTADIYYDNFEYTNNVEFHKAFGQNIDYSASLENVGDFYEITFDIINKSDFDIKIVDYYCPTNDNYINYELTYNNGKKISLDDTLKQGETKRFKYKVSYVNLVTEDNYEFDSSFSIQYEQKF